MTTSQGRWRLLAEVNSLHATHKYTNEDEAAKLIELISLQLRNAYGAQANQLVVHIYSDFESSPSADKQRFSVGRLLSERMGADFSQLTLEETPKSAADEVDSATHSAERPATVSPARAVAPSSRPPVVAMCAASGCLLAIMVLLAVVAARRRHRGAEESEFEALLVTETGPAENPDTPPTVHPVRRIEVATGVPAVFSTDPKSATYIATAIPGETAGELFRIVPLPGGRVRVECSQPGLTVNEAPYSNERKGISLAEPIRLRLGPWEFAICGVVRRARAITENDVFEAGAVQR